MNIMDEHLVEELKSDERLEKAYNFWKAYKVYILGGIAFVLLVTSATVYWNYKEHQRKSDLSTKYFKAIRMLESGKGSAVEDKAISLLREVALDKDYGPFASFAIANYKSFANKEKEALVEYDKIDSMRHIRGVYRDLAVIKRAYMRIDNKDFADLSGELERISLGIGPWKSMAQELLAIIKLKKGEKQKAYNILDEIINDEMASKQTKYRAMALKNYG